MRLALLSSLLLSACTSTGDALVVVTVSSTATVSGIQSFRVDAVANGHAGKEFSVTPAGGSAFDIPPSKTFAVIVPAAFAGPFSLSLDALDANMKTLISGSATTTTTAGKESMLEIMLGVVLTDGGLDANLDAAGDLAGADLTCIPMTCAAAGYGCGMLSTCGQNVDCGPCSVTSVHPSIANSGDTITLEGRFSPAIMVAFPGGAMIAPATVGPNRATVVVPATATEGTVGVTIPGGVGGLRQPFRRATFKLTLGDFRQNYEQPVYARPMPRVNTPRQMGDANMILGETVMVFGGMPAMSGPSPTPVPIIEEADIALDGEVGTFNGQGTGRMLVQPRANFVTFNAARNQPYVIGGFDGTATLYGSIEVGQTNGDGSGISSFTTTALQQVTPRAFAASAIIGSYLYVIGGATAFSASSFTGTNTIERSLIGTDGSLGPFQIIPTQLGTARIAAFTFVGQNKLYVMGGTPDAKTFLTSIEEAPINPDGTLGSFSTANISLTLDRAIAGVFELNGLYVLGGASTHLGVDSDAKPVTDIEHSPIGPNGNLGAFVASSVTLAEPRAAQPLLIGDYLYFFNSGSGDGIAERASIVDGNARFSVFAPSPITLTTPRWGMAAAVVGKYMFLFGGSSFNGSTGSALPALVRATIADDGTLGQFSSVGLPNLATQRVGASVAVFGRTIFVCGGQTNPSTKLFDCEQIQVAYDGSITVAPAGLTLANGNPREHFQLAAIDGTLYAIGDDFSTVDSVPFGPNGINGNFVSNPMAFFDKSPQKMAIVSNNFDYLIGGTQSSAIEQAAFGGAIPVSFDSASGVTMPGPRGDALVLSTGSTAFLLGGLASVASLDAGVSSPPALNDIVAGSLALGSAAQTVLGPFSSAGMMMTARQQASGIILDNNVYVIGGADAVGASFNPLGTVEQATIQ